jgi:CRISPR system Cascade subunit CasE
MFLSSIPVETGNNPNRLWPGKRWVINPYRVHQRLWMAFDGQRDERFLFRLEGPIMTARGLRPRLLVQSVTEPNWDAAFRNAPFLVVKEDVGVRPYDPRFRAGQSCRFVLRANPTRRLGKSTAAALTGDNKPKSAQPRLGITDPGQQVEWLRRKGNAAGFSPTEVQVLTAGRKHVFRGKQPVELTDQSGNPKLDEEGNPLLGLVDPPRQIHLAAVFGGQLEVTDPALFLQALRSGIGPAKAFGFGLLSVAPIS